MVRPQSSKDKAKEDAVLSRSPAAGPEHKTSLNLLRQDGLTETFFLECLESFSHLPLFGEDLVGLRGMLVVAPIPCLHPLHLSTGHIALHASLCDTGPLPCLSPINSEVTQGSVGIYGIFQCLQKT